MDDFGVPHDFGNLHMTATAGWLYEQTRADRHRSSLGGQMEMWMLAEQVLRTIGIVAAQNSQ